MAIFLGSNEIDYPSILEGIEEVRLGNNLVWQAGLPVGTVFNFEYTGAVQSVELPRGKYKLQCWGAQGGTSAGSSNGVGSKGGYSEGVLTLTEKTTLYIFVGGQGSRGSSSSLVNGGWNGGGASVGYTSYNSGSTNGYSYPACGGGATDISTVDSSMSYSDGRTNRNAASLLARCIVAGGGAGGSFRYTVVTTTTTTTSWVSKGSLSKLGSASDNGTPAGCYFQPYSVPFDGSGTYRISITSSSSNYWYAGYRIARRSDWAIISESTSLSSFSVNFNTYPTSSYSHSIYVYSKAGSYAGATISATLYKQESTPSTSTSSSSGYSNQSQVGGGTSGGGQYPGTQSAGGSGSQAGGFGYGANQPTTGNRYDSGAGGGGWYGGGSYTSDSSTSAVNYSGGGSGFVNTSANASYRPSGYTGLQLDSGETIAGNTSHPSTDGGTETGHSGNGYARITVIK